METKQHDVPTGWPEMLRTDKAIKLAYALEAAGYLNEDWQPGPKLYCESSGSLNTSKASYVARQFRDYLKKGQSYSPVFTQYWNANIDRTLNGQSKPIPEIDAITFSVKYPLPLTPDSKDFLHKLYDYSLSMVGLQEEITQLICNTIRDSQDWRLFRDFVRNVCPDDMKISEAFDRFTGNLITAAANEATAIMAEALEE